MKEKKPDNISSNPFGINTSRTAAMRILVVDDDSSLADFLKQFLEELAFYVEVASSGEEALSMINDGADIDIALVDYRLPGMDGLETITRISGLSPGTVTMIITGLPTLDSSIRAMRLGASNYILKPFNLDDLASAIKKAMKEREIRSEVKKLREKVAALEENSSSTKNISVNESVKSTSSINTIPKIKKYPQRPSTVE